MGRRKIPIEIIDKKTARDICFSKQRKGLFSKAKKLARAGSKITILIFSKVGNVFSFSHPSIQSVADPFLSPENRKDGSSGNDKFHGNADIVARGSDAASGGLTRSSGEGESSTKGDELDGGDAIRQDKALESDDEEDELESEASSEAKVSDIAGSSQVEHAAMQDAEHATGGESATEEETRHSGRFWWNKRIDDLELHELVEFESALEGLREKVRDRAKQILVEKPMMGHHLDFSKYRFKFPQQTSQD